MRILLIYTNTYRMLAAAPLGASLVASHLRKDGHKVKLVDLMFADDPAALAAREAREFRPDLVCYSVRNVDSQSATDFFDPLPTIQSVARAVRGVTSVPTLVGGTAFTTFPEQILEALGVDYGIAGDALAPISRFVASLEAGEPDLDVPGLVYRADRGIRCNPYEIRGYPDLAFEGWDLIDYRPYRRCLSAFWEGAVVTKTGCPFECVFCDAFRTFGDRYVLRDPRQIAEEALRLQRLGVRSLFFADGGFNRPLEHAKAVLAAMLDAGVHLSIGAVFEPGEVDRGFAELYRRAGGREILLFATSLSPAVIARLRKPYQLDDVLLGARLLDLAGVGSLLFLGLGGPGETPDTVEETLGLAKALRPVYTILDHGFRVQPGTALREIALGEGQVAPDDDCFRATFYHSPETPAELLAARIARFQAEQRLANLRALPWGLRLAWRKLAPRISL